MTDPTQFEKPDPEQDRLRPGKILLIGVIGFAVGFLIVWLREGGHRVAEPQHEEATQAQSARARPSGSEAEAEAGSEAGSGSESGSESGSASESGSDSVADAAIAAAPVDAGLAAIPPTEPVVDTTTPIGTFARGRIAYLRCEGMGGSDAACPRDEPMEDAVWSILETLPRCANPPRGTGLADVRLEFTHGGSTEVSMRARAEDHTHRLDGERVLGCVAGQLSHVQTSIRATRVIASFRFQME